MTISLIDCPACRKKVSSQAETCPNCGQPIRPVLRKNSPIRSKGIPSIRIRNNNDFSGWSKEGTKTGQGPSATWHIHGIPLTSDAILHKIRKSFEQSGFSLEQSTYDAGEATTGGILIGGDGGFVAGQSFIENKTWNPFLVKSPGCGYLRTKIEVIQERHHMRALSDTRQLDEYDIEVTAKIEQPTALVTFLAFFLATVLGFIFMIVGHFYGSRTSRDENYIQMLIGGVVGGCIGFFVIPYVLWTTANFKNMQDAVDNAMNQSKQDLSQP